MWRRAPSVQLFCSRILLKLAARDLAILATLVCVARSPLASSASLLHNPPSVTQVGPSVSGAQDLLAELKRWNEQFGEGGSRKDHGGLTYFM